MSVRDLIILGSSSQQPTRNRNHGAYLLRWNQEGFLFDPGEGTQRQFIYANVAPPTVNRIFISHFHGDHCLGLGSMLMRLNLDGVEHPIHCYYPASGKVYFDRLRYGTIYQEKIHVIEHPVSEDGLVEETEQFKIEAFKLDHKIDNYGWRITEKDQRKFHKDQLQDIGLKGPAMKKFVEDGSVSIDGKTYRLEDVSYIRKGDVFSVVIDTRPCSGAKKTAEGATWILAESTYTSEHLKLAKRNYHLTASQAAQIALDSDAKELFLTHFSARYYGSEVFNKEAKKIFPNTHAVEDLDHFHLLRREEYS